MADANANANAIARAAVTLALARHGLKGALVRRKAADYHDRSCWGATWWQVEIRSGVLDWMDQRRAYIGWYSVDITDPYLKYRWDRPFLTVLEELIAALKDFNPGAKKRVLVGTAEKPYILRKNP